MDKELAGQPLWLWALGAVVVVGGFLYFRSHSSSSNLQQPAQPAGGQSTSHSTFSETIKDMQSNPKPKKKKSGDN